MAQNSALPSAWYYASNKSKVGPISWEQLNQLVVAGTLKPTDMVLQEGTTKWQAVSTVPLLNRCETAPPMLASTDTRPRESLLAFRCTHCGASLQARDGKARGICPSCHQSVTMNSSGASTATISTAMMATAPQGPPRLGQLVSSSQALPATTKGRGKTTAVPLPAVAPVEQSGSWLATVFSLGLGMLFAGVISVFLSVFKPQLALGGQLAMLAGMMLLLLVVAVFKVGVGLAGAQESGQAPLFAKLRRGFARRFSPSCGGGLPQS